MTPNTNTKIINKSTCGALWATRDPYRPRKEVQTPPGNQNGGPRPLWGTILIIFGTIFNVFQ